MNVRGGWGLIRRSWASWLQHRNFFFLLAFGWMVPPLIYLFVWSTAARGAAAGGMTQAQFVGYYLLLILVNQITYSQTNWTLGDIIRDGSLSIWLLRPMTPLFNVLASEVAGKVVYMTFVIPVAAVLALLLHPEISPTPAQGLAFVPALAAAWLLRFAWGFMLAEMAFWATRADALLAAQDALIFLLGGQVAPVTLLPGALRALAVALPFRYMLGFPVEVLAGGLSGSEIGVGFAFQTFWLALALGLAIAGWRRGLLRYSAMGG